MHVDLMQENSAINCPPDDQDWKDLFRVSGSEK